MIICEKCGKKYIRKDFYEKHLADTHGEPLPPKEIPKVEEVKVETPVEPVVNPEPVVLHFNQDVEVILNGVAYRGKEITVNTGDYHKNVEIASQIVSIAQEAYGQHIFA